MLRVHFTPEDLLRTRFAAAPAPLIELGMALATLQRRDLIFDGWRRRTRAALPVPARPLFELVPPTATGPLFLDPVSNGIEDGLDTVLSTPTPTVRGELRRVCAAGRPITPWIRALDERDPEAWQALARGLYAMHDTVVRPVWPQVWDSFRGEIAWRGRLIAESGLRDGLASIHPSGRWRDTTLEFDVDSTLSVHLSGRGLTLLPSAFWTGRPMITHHPDGSILVVYPALTALPLVDAPAGGDALADLLGRTRAAVLELAVTQRTTGELARELGMSLASVSAHARTLRAAGLLVSERAGKRVLHSITPLGDRLLAGAALRPAPRAPSRVGTFAVGGQL